MRRRVEKRWLWGWKMDFVYGMLWQGLVWGFMVKEERVDGMLRTRMREGMVNGRWMEGDMEGT